MWTPSLSRWLESGDDQDNDRGKPVWVLGPGRSGHGVVLARQEARRPILKQQHSCGQLQVLSRAHGCVAAHPEQLRRADTRAPPSVTRGREGFGTRRGGTSPLLYVQGRVSTGSTLTRGERSTRPLQTTEIGTEIPLSDER